MKALNDLELRFLESLVAGEDDSALSPAEVPIAHALLLRGLVAEQPVPCRCGRGCFGSDYFATQTARVLLPAFRAALGGAS